MLRIVAKYFKLLRIVSEKFAWFGVVPLPLISYYLKSSRHVSIQKDESTEVTRLYTATT